MQSMAAARLGVVTRHLLMASASSSASSTTASSTAFYSTSAASSKLKTILQSQLKDIEDAGTYKRERVITSKQGPNITVQSSSQNVLNFCANNYLGLAGHPEVIAAAQDALTTRGAGLSSVRFICGTQDIHKDLENKIAKFHNRESAILFPSCFDANAGIFETLLTPEDAVISDELNHASIIDGIRLCKARKYKYKHRDMSDLKAQLEASKDARLRMIVTDGVFSMDGNVAPLKEICDLADKYEALVFIDECHATGFFGKTGRGTEEFLGVEGRVDIINSTLGKAMGGASGGYTTGSKEVIDMLRQKARPYLFSNTLAPAVVGASSKAFDLILKDPSLCETVASNTAYFRSKMTAAGFTILGDNHPICPVWLGDARLASQFADTMLKKGIYVIGFSFPVVPKGKARIRVQISAAHTKADIDRAINAFIEVGKELKVIP